MSLFENPEELRRAILNLPPELRPLCDGLDHLGVAVAELEQILPLYRDLLELPFLGTETIESDGVRVAIFDLKGPHLELLEPTSQESPVAKFLKKRGPGLHHVALRVKNCADAVRVLREAGITMIDETPRGGASNKLIAFCHPRSTGGVLLELCERST
ncbi:MAG TPA: methylmalonyl-CoA epimerase [Candidatus Krumholzibacteria bacterium]|nr:methylmalonyl-CoA epimerase [Candidatus Krumholzibacteria bacterium]